MCRPASALVLFVCILTYSSGQKRQNKDPVIPVSNGKVVETQKILPERPKFHHWAMELVKHLLNGFLSAYGIFRTQ